MVRVSVPPGHGARRLEDFFPGVRVRVDHVFRMIVPHPGISAVRSFECEILPLSEDVHPVNEQLPAKRLVVSFLAYLGSDGRELLAIPLILGVWIYKGKSYMLFVEYKKEHEVEVIHLHAREPEDINDDNFMFVRFV